MKKIILCLSILLTACGGNYKTETANYGISIGEQNASVLSGSIVQSANGSLTGTGSIIFQTDLGSVKSGHSYALQFSLQDTGQIHLISHANDGLSNGLELRLRRTGSGLGSLSATLVAQSTERKAIDDNGANLFAQIDAALPIKLQVDVHNDETPAHVIIWNTTDSSAPSEANEIYNSAEEIDGSPGVGSGARWGISMENATLSHIELSGPKESH